MIHVQARLSARFAAILFAAALGAFSTSQIVFIKELGLGAAWRC